MTSKTSTRGDLPPLPFEQVTFKRVTEEPEVIELHGTDALFQWTAAQASWNRYEAAKASIGNVSADEYEERAKQIARRLGL